MTKKKKAEEIEQEIETPEENSSIEEETLNPVNQMEDEALEDIEETQTLDESDGYRQAYRDHGSCQHDNAAQFLGVFRTHLILVLEHDVQGEDGAERIEGRAYGAYQCGEHHHHHEPEKSLGKHELGELEIRVGGVPQIGQEYEGEYAGKDEQGNVQDLEPRAEIGAHTPLVYILRPEHRLHHGLVGAPEPDAHHGISYYQCQPGEVLVAQRFEHVPVVGGNSRYNLLHASYLHQRQHHQQDGHAYEQQHLENVGICYRLKASRHGEEG